MVHDVASDEFDEKVIGRSHEVPVVVDFWAEWCGPCRQLGPVLETAAAAREGRVELAKVDVDRNQALAAGFGVQGIPAVKAFRDGKIADEFVGAQPPAKVEAFFDGLAPSEAEALAEAGDEVSLRRALELDPRNARAAAGLAKILIEQGQDDAAREALAPVEADYLAAGLLARLELAQPENGGELDRLGEAFTAWDEGDHAMALDRLQEEMASSDDPVRADLLRRVMVGIFTELGPSDPLAIARRRRLATALN